MLHTFWAYLVVSIVLLFFNAERPISFLIFTAIVAQTLSSYSFMPFESEPNAWDLRVTQCHLGKTRLLSGTCTRFTEV